MSPASSPIELGTPRSGRRPSFWQAFPALEGELAMVSSRMEAAARSDNEEINLAVRDLVEGDGKLLRPALLLICSRFGTKRPKKMIDLAAALELLHAATLIHDDVIDDSPMRRGLPSAQSRFGKRDAVLVGDFLLARCLSLTARYTSPKNAMHLADAIGVICRMEIEQDMSRFRIDPSLRRYLRRILGKTALLFSLACYVGAEESKADPGTVSRVRRAGYAMGMAFQIIDDILDYESDESSLRKPVGNDLRAGLSTLPLICALRLDGGTLSALVNGEAFVHADPSRIIALVRESGGLDEARSHARRYTDYALRDIERLADGEGKTMLSALALRLLDRSY